MSRRGDNIRKRKDGRWEGRYKERYLPDGQTKYRSVYGKTYSEVKQKLLSYAAETSKVHLPRKELIFTELADMWLTSNTIRLKESTIRKYRILLAQHILPDLGGLRLSQLSAPLINNFLDNKLHYGSISNGAELSPSYVSTMRIVIMAIIQLGVNERYCSPFRSRIYKPVTRTQDITVLSENCCNVLEEGLSANIDRDGLGILIALHTGMRIGEICALQWNDIDFVHNIIKVRRTVTRVQAAPEESVKSKLILGSPKTKSSVREIPINSFLQPLLLKIREQSVSTYILSDKANFVSPRTFEYRFHKKLRELCVRKINFHALRHTFATRCIRHGVDEKSLSEILGHSDVSTTLKLYVHSSMDMKRIQLEKIA